MSASDWQSWTRRWRDANLLTDDQVTAITRYELQMARADDAEITLAASHVEATLPRSLSVGTVVGVTNLPSEAQADIATETAMIVGISRKRIMTIFPQL